MTGSHELNSAGRNPNGVPPFSAKRGEASATVKIIPYADDYRDDMIFMVLLARDALGIPIRIREDLLDIPGSYLEKGDGFWLALDERDRVVGCVGYSRIGDTDEAFLHRLFIKPDRKRQGIGARLLETAEGGMRARGIRVARVHLGEPREQWFEAYAFYPKHGYAECAPRYMAKIL